MTTKNMFNLDGKRALATGGSRGIGRAIAVELRESGAQVVSVLVPRILVTLMAYVTLRPMYPRSVRSPDLVDEVEKNLWWAYRLGGARCGCADTRCPRRIFHPSSGRGSSISTLLPRTCCRRRSGNDSSTRNVAAHIYL